MPVFQPYVPGVNTDKEKLVKDLFNAYIDTMQQLEWLLTHLDERNVIRARTAIIAEIFAGNITTDQIIAGVALINNALIESLSATKITAGTLDLSDSITIKGEKEEIIIDEFGMDTKFIKWFKNMCWNSSFEVFNSEGKPAYWDGGISSSDSNFFGTWSLKLEPTETSISTGWINPQWYNDVSTKTRVSFHKKFGAVRVSVLDGDNLPFTLTDENGNTGTYIDYVYNENWIPPAYTVSFTHGSATSIKVKFENIDATNDSYIDGVIVEPDYTGRRPSFYSDGVNSKGNIVGEEISSQTPTKAYRNSNTSLNTVDTTETLVCAESITLPVRSDVHVTFSMSSDTTGIQQLTAKTYLTTSLGTVTRDYQPTMSGGNLSLFNYTDTIKGLSAGEITIEIKVFADINDFSIDAEQAVLSIIVIPNLEVPISATEIFDITAKSTSPISELYMVGIFHPEFTTGTQTEVKSTFDINSALPTWSHKFYLGDTLDAAIEFDGSWVKEDSLSVLKTDDLPWVFWINTSNELYGQHYDDTSTLIKLSETVTKVSAVRGWKTTIEGDYANDQGLVVAYVKSDGEAYYRQYKIQDGFPTAWASEELLVFPDVTEPITDIQVTRTNDFRLLFAAESDGDTHVVVTKRTWIGQSIDDHHLSADIVDITVDVSKITYHEAFTKENISTSIVDIEIVVLWGIAYNAFVESENDGSTTILARTEYGLTNLAHGSFEVRDDDNLLFSVTDISQGATWRDFVLTVEDLSYANQSSLGAGDLTLKFLGSGGTKGEAGQDVDPFEITFTPTGLIFIPDGGPEVEVIWNE